MNDLIQEIGDFSGGGAALISLLVTDAGFCEQFFSFQPGTAYKHYNNGDSAAGCGHEFLIKTRTMTYTSRAFELAAKNNHFEILKYLLNLGIHHIKSPNILGYAARSGNQEMIDYVLARETPSLASAKYALKYASVATIGRLLRILCRVCPLLVETVIKNRQIAAVELVCKQLGDFPFNSRHYLLAIKAGNLPLIKHLDQLGIKPGTDNWKLEAINSKMDVIEYIGRSHNISVSVAPYGVVVMTGALIIDDEAIGAFITPYTKLIQKIATWGRDKIKIGVFSDVYMDALRYFVHAEYAFTLQFIPDDLTMYILWIYRDLDALMRLRSNYEISALLPDTKELIPERIRDDVFDILNMIPNTNN